MSSGRRAPALAWLGSVVALCSLYATVSAPAEAVEPTSAIASPDRVADIGPDSIAVGVDTACAIRSSGRLRCWGGADADPGLLEPPAGRYIGVDVDWDDACGLRRTGRISCWAAEGNDPLEPPRGRFTDVGVGQGLGCALRAADARVTCWGAEMDPAPPGGALIALTVADRAACGLRSSGRGVCWGSLIGGLPAEEIPNGRFIDVEISSARACVLRATGRAACFSDSTQSVPPPRRTFTSLAVAYSHTCGLRPSQEIICWGDDSFGEFDPPSGTYSELAGGNAGSCARDPGVIACWGRLPPPRPTVPASAAG